MTSNPTPIRAEIAPASAPKSRPPVAEKLPPFDVQAEASVVASVLVDDQALDRIGGMLSPADFYRDQHHWLYAAALAVHGRGETVNQVTVAHELSRAGKLDDCGGLAYIAQLTAELPTPIGVEHYAAIVRRDATYRTLISVGQQIVLQAYKGGADLDAVLRAAERLVRDVAQREDGEYPTKSIGELLDAWWEQPGVNSVWGNAGPAVRTGIRDVDSLAAGFAPGNLVIVAARTGVGKSTFLLNIARNAAHAQNMRTVLFSLEMSHEECMTRLLALESKIEQRRLRLGDMAEHEEREAMSATAELHPLPIDVHDQAGIRIEQIRAALRRRQHKRGGVDLVLVDYLQLVRGSGRHADNRVAEVSDLSRGLKELAKEFEVPVIAAAQLSREVDKRTPPKPRLSDLRESGSIEQDADIVILLSPLSIYGSTYSFPGWLVDIAKNRHGPSRECVVGVELATGRTWDVGEPQEDA